MKNKLCLYGVLSFAALFSLVSLSARADEFHGGGEGYHGGNSFDHSYNNGYDRHYGNYGDEGGYEGNGYWGGGYWISPYPGPESEPGMGDDSNALYQSYLHDTGY